MQKSKTMKVITVVILIILAIALVGGGFIALLG